MKLLKTIQLTKSPLGATYHDQSGNTSSLFGKYVGYNDGGEKWIVRGINDTGTMLIGQKREQLWCTNTMVVEWFNQYEVKVDGQKLTLPQVNSPGFIRWTIVPAAENNLDKHGDVIWFWRRAWIGDRTVAPVFFCKWTRTTNKFEVVKLADISPEKNVFRKQELHAVHQYSGRLLWMHERERSGVYNRDSFEKVWYHLSSGGSVVRTGIGMDHPTCRNDMLLFTGPQAIMWSGGKPTNVKFEENETCQHQYLDDEGNLVCSIQSRKQVGTSWTPWLETEIRVYSFPGGNLLATIPLNQSDQQESGNAFALLSRPFGGTVEGLGYCVFYHAPSPEDNAKPIAERVPQCWVALLGDDDVKPPMDDTTKRIADLEFQLQTAQQEFADFMRYVKQEFSRPLTVVKGQVPQ